MMALARYWIDLIDHIMQILPLSPSRLKMPDRDKVPASMTGEVGEGEGWSVECVWRFEPHRGGGLVCVCRRPR